MASLPQSPFYIPEVHAVASYSYDAINLIVTITGSTATFAGWYSADVAGGWGTIGRTSTSQYYLVPAKLEIVYFGDGSTTTVFSDSRVQVDVVGVVSWTVKNNATLQLGRLIDLSKKEVDRTVQIINNYQIYAQSGSTLYLYGVSVRFGQVIAQGANRIWGCQFDTVTLSPKNTDMYNCILGTTYFKGSEYEVSGTTDLTNGFAAYLLSITQNYNFSISNVNFKGSSGIVSTFNSYTWTGQANLINVISDTWAISWLGISDKGKVWRKYTFSLTVTYPNGTAIPNASVTLTYSGQGGGTVGSWLTNSTGQISTKTLTMGFYNQTGGNTIYDYNPYKLEITSSYGNYTKEWTLNEKTSWEIAVTVSNPATEETWGLPLTLAFVLIGCIVTGAYFISTKKD